MSSVIYLNLLAFYVQRCVPSVDHLCKSTGHREKRVGSEVALPQATVATIDNAEIDPGSDLETFDIEASFVDMSICSV